MMIWGWWKGFQKSAIGSRGYDNFGWLVEK